RPAADPLRLVEVVAGRILLYGPGVVRVRDDPVVLDATRAADRDVPGEEVAGPDLDELAGGDSRAVHVGEARPCRVQPPLREACGLHEVEHVLQRAERRTRHRIPHARAAVLHGALEPGEPGQAARCGCGSAVDIAPQLFRDDDAVVARLLLPGD